MDNHIAPPLQSPIKKNLDEPAAIQDEPSETLDKTEPTSHLKTPQSKVIAENKRNRKRDTFGDSILSTPSSSQETSDPAPTRFNLGSAKRQLKLNATANRSRASTRSKPVASFTKKSTLSPNKKPVVEKEKPKNVAFEKLAMLSPKKVQEKPVQKLDKVKTLEDLKAQLQNRNQFKKQRPITPKKSDLPPKLSHDSVNFTITSPSPSKKSVMSPAKAGAKPSPRKKLTFDNLSEDLSCTPLPKSYSFLSEMFKHLDCQMALKVR